MASSTISIIINGTNNTSAAFDGMVGHAQSAFGRIAEIAGGVSLGNILANAFQGAISAGRDLIGNAVEIVRTNERLELSFTSMIGRELMKASTTEKLVQVGTQYVTAATNMAGASSLSAKEMAAATKAVEAGETAQARLAKVTADIQAKVVALGEAQKKKGESDAAFIARTNQMRASLMVLKETQGDLEQAVQKGAAAQAKMTATMGASGTEGGRLVPVYKTVREQTLAYADAQKIAAEKSKELIGWAEKLAINSPFDKADVTKGLKLAMSYGFSTEEAKRLTQANINLSSAFGQEGEVMGRVALALGQISQKGKLQGDDLRQLTNAAVPLREILIESGKVAGLTGDSFDKMMKKGLIPAKAALEAYYEFAEKNFGTAAKDQANSFSGLLESLKDIQKVLIADFFTPAFKTVQPYLAQFVEAIQTPAIRQTIAGWGQGLAGVVGQFLGFATSVSATVGTAVTALSRFTTPFQAIREVIMSSFSPEMWRPMLDGVATVEGTIGSINLAFAGFAANLPALSANLPAIGAAFMTMGSSILTGLAPAFAALGPMVNAAVSLFSVNLTGALTTFNGFVTTFAPQLQALWGSVWSGFGLVVQTAITAVTLTLNTFTPIVQLIFNNISLFLTQHGGQILTTLQTAWNTVVAVVTTVIGVAQTTITTIFTAVSSYLATHGTEIQATLSTAWMTIQQIVEGAVAIIKEWVIPTFQTIGTFIATHSNEIQTVIGVAWRLISTAIQTALTVIKGVVNVVLAGVRGDWSLAWNAVREITASVLNLIVAVLRSAFDLLGVIVRSALDLIKLYWVQNWDAIKTHLGHALDAIKAAINTGLDLVKNQFLGALDGIVLIIQGFTGNMSSAGVQLMKGLAQGIRDTVTYVIEEAKRAGQVVVDTIKATLGIKSPSTVMIEAGKFVNEGLALGISDSADLAANAMSKSGQLMLEAARDTLGIRSPSTETTEMGKQTAQGFQNGLTARFRQMQDVTRQELLKIASQFGVLKNSSATIGNLIAGMSPDSFKNLSDFTTFVTSAMTKIKDEARLSFSGTDAQWRAATNGMTESARQARSHISSAWAGIKADVAQNATGIKELMSNSWASINEQLTDGVKPEMDAFRKDWRDMQNEYVVTNRTIKREVGDTWSDIGKLISKATEAARLQIKQTKDQQIADLGAGHEAEKAAIRAHYDELNKGITASVAALREGAGEEWTQLKDFIADTTRTLKQDQSDTWREITQLVSDGGKDIKGEARKDWDELTKIVNAATKAAKDGQDVDWGAIEATIKSKTGSISSDVQSKFTEIVAAIRAKIDESKNNQDEVWGAIRAKIFETVTAIAGSTKDTFGKMGIDVSALVDTLMKNVQASFKGIGDASAEAANVTSTSSAAIAASYNVVSTAAETAADAVTAANTTMVTVASAAAQQIAAQMIAAGQAINTTQQQLANFVQSGGVGGIVGGIYTPSQAFQDLFTQNRSATDNTIDRLITVDDARRNALIRLGGANTGEIPVAPPRPSSVPKGDVINNTPINITINSNGSVDRYEVESGTMSALRRAGLAGRFA